MKKILFVCHGNICRSPMAEFVFKNLVTELGYANDFEVNSAATSTEEIGNSIHSGTIGIFNKYHIPYTNHHSIQMTKNDYQYYDYLIGMDSANIKNMLHISGGDPDQKIYRMLSFLNETRDVADPWYTRNFEDTYSDICSGCKAFLKTFDF